MSKLLLRPDNSSYALQRGPEVLSVKLDGGASKYRRDILDASFDVDVTWILNPDQYDYLNAFFRLSTVHGSLPFTIDLLLDNTDFATYTARFSPSTFKLTGQKGLAYFVSATLEVENPVNVDEATEDAAIIAAYEAAHDDDD